MRIPLVLLAGCSAALPPPRPPVLHGTITASGGALGDWALTPAEIRPVDGDLDALDLVDPAAPGRVVRLIRTAAEPEQKPKGIQESVASRAVELRVASDGHEVVLAPERCTRLDAIARAAHGVAFASARFDCTVDGNHVTGDFELAAGGFVTTAPIGGYLEADDATLAHTRFQPDQAELDPKGAIVWDHRYPRVVFELDAEPTDPSVLGSGSNAHLRVRSTASAVGTFDVSRCLVIRLSRHESGFVRVGTHQHTLWSGTVDIDCDTPAGGRLTGKLEVNG